MQLRIQGVNALNGLSSFLQENLKIVGINEILCQRPKRAFFISTESKVYLRSVFMSGVNALNGLSSFLRRKGKIWAIKMCVNALNGLSSFLLTWLIQHIPISFLVSTP